MDSIGPYLLDYYFGSLTHYQRTTFFYHSKMKDFADDKKIVTRIKTPPGWLSGDSLPGGCEFDPR